MSNSNFPSKPNFSEMLATSDADAAVAKVSRDAVEAYLMKRLKAHSRTGSSIINKKAGYSVYDTTQAKDIIEKRYHWLVARNFEITQITDYIVVFIAKDAWGKSIGEFTVHINELQLSTWDFAVKVRRSINYIKMLKVDEAKRTEEQDLKKLRDQVKAAQKALDNAIQAVEARKPKVATTK